MKKLLSLVLAISLITLALPTAALADSDPGPFDFSKLLTEEGDAIVEDSSGIKSVTLTDGFYVAASNNSSLDGILSTSTLNGIPVFLLGSPISSTKIWPAAQTSEQGKIISVVFSGIIDDNWHLTSYSSSLATSKPIRRTESSDIIGYTGDLSFSWPYDENYCMMQLFVSTDNSVYPIIASFSDSKSNPVPVWKEFWPKTNEELTTLLRQQT